MFKDKRSSKKTYESYDSWSKKAKDRTANSNAPTRTNSQKSSNKDKKPTIWRSFGGSKDYKELFPRPESNKPSPTNTSRNSTEGKAGTRGSIRGTTAMGPEGSSGSNYSGVNPDLRRRLAEKKRKEAQEQRDNRMSAKRDEKISAQKKALRKKQQLRQAIIAAEIIGPPKAKKFS